MTTNGELITMANGTSDKQISQKMASNKISLFVDQSTDDVTMNSVLLDKIRKQAKQRKNWNDLAKLSRTFLYEKRHPIISDQQEKGQLQRCLDTIQKSIKVTSLQSMTERLETISRQLGLTFHSINEKVFISSEMFYVEVILDQANGCVNDVKIAHSAEASSCPELTKVLSEADFVEFTKHLNGLSEIYRLSADKTKKSKAYVALNALEQDLNLLSKLQQSSINEPNNLVHKSPVGILEPRKGGRPMKLTYFISPYDLLDEKRRTSFPLSIDIITEKKLGYSAKICLQNLDKNYYKLQTTPLISLTKVDGKNFPCNSPINNSNSISLPACFALKLSESLPLSIEIVEKIKQANNGLDVIFDKEISTTTHPLISLLAKKMLSKKEFNKFRSVGDPFYVELPDQSHTYYFNSSISSIMGYEVTSIPFIHPTSVPQILVLLRKQVLFNVLIGSCIRQIYRKDELKTDNPLMFEITALSSITSINVSFEHPAEDSLATIDFDLEELTNIKAKLYDSQSFSTYVSDEHVSLVMQRCFSIPVTMRSVIKKCQDKVALIKEELRKKQAQLMQIRPNDIQSENTNAFYNQQQMISNDPSEHSTNCNNLINNKFDNYQQHSMPASANNNLQNMLQTNQQRSIYQQQQQSRNYTQQQIQQQQLQQTKSNTMLMTMLSDVPAANTQTSLNNPSNPYFLQQQLNLGSANNPTPAVQPKVKKQRKRKNQDSNIKSPSSYGRSPKRKISEDDAFFARDLPTPGSDYMENSYENYHSVGSNQPLSRPSSTASSNSIQFPSIKQDPDIDSNSQHFLGDLQDQNRNFNFLDNSAVSSFDFNKRKRSLDASSTTFQERNDEMLLQDNFNQTKFNAINKNYSSTNLKSPNGSLIEKKIGTLETMLKDAGSMPKKERKRKKADNDTNKNVGISSVMVSNMQLMPPPSTMVSTITASSPTSSSSSANTNAYGFVEMDSGNVSIGSPALRPITLNVKSSATNSLNTANVSITGVKVNDKNLSNKLRQGSPKTTESDSFSMPNYSPKSSPKMTKPTKQAKVIHTPMLSGSSTANSPKSQQSIAKQQSSLKFKSLNTSGPLIAATKTATTSPVSISPPSNASPLSPKQNPLLLAKTMQAKKNSKGSLNAVIDKLRVNATSSSNDDSNGASSTTAANLQSSSSANAMEIIFKSSDQSNKSENKLTTSPAGNLSSKLNESKIKYNRPEFTVKQSGALKFTVTKTTKSPSVEQTKTKNVNNKSNVSSNKVLPSSSPGTGSSLFAQQKQSSNNKTSTGIKRQLSTTNFKSNNQQVNKSSSTNKSLSPESADQILEAALPKIQLDKLPKIPKTLNSQFNLQQNQQTNQQSTQSTNSQTAAQQSNKNNFQAKFLQQQQLKQQNLLKQQMINYNNSLGNNNFRKYGTNNQRNASSDQTNQSQQDNSMQITRTATEYGGNMSSLSSSKATISNDNQTSQSENESQKNESNKSIASKQSFTSQINKSATSTLSTVSSTVATSSSITTIANPSSTPSSPMECNVIPDVYQKSPPLIPTETIEETPNIQSSSSLSSTSNQFQKSKIMFGLSSSSLKKHSTNLESTIAKLTDKQQPSITSFNLTSTNKLLTQSSKVFLEDDDDEERLFIADVSESSKKTTPSKVIDLSSKVESSPNKLSLEKATSSDINSGTNSIIPSSSNEVSSGTGATKLSPNRFSIDDELMDEALGAGSQD